MTGNGHLPFSASSAPPFFLNTEARLKIGDVGGVPDWTVPTSTPHQPCVCVSVQTPLCQKITVQIAQQQVGAWYKMYAYRTLSMVCFAVLAGCVVNPSTGRNQLIALPALQIAHANAGFALTSAGQDLAFSSPCAWPKRGAPVAVANRSPCPTAKEIETFTRQVERIAEELASEVRIFAPALFSQIGMFHIGLARGMSAGTASSAGGTIVLASDLAALDPTDDVVAFLIAREMGHVIARHGEEDSGARMVFSVISLIVPGIFIVKFAGSMLGSQALTKTWAEAQRREADELALVLLARCNRSRGRIAFHLRVGLKHERLPASEWGSYFTQSIERVKIIVLDDPIIAQLAIPK